MRVYIFGAGYVGAAFARQSGPVGRSVTASARSDEAAAALTAEGIQPAAPMDYAPVARADAILLTAPPDERGCPALDPVVAALTAGAKPGWIGYLSSTGVYGDRGGGWVCEDGALRAQSVAGARRVAAEQAWMDVGSRYGVAVTIFRLPGIYGPGRSAFDRLRDGTARRIVRPGQVFSRIHVDDLVGALEASIARPRANGIYNICDDEPSPPQDVITEAARLLGVDPPPEVPFDGANVPAASQRFFAESKRVSNARAKAELGWRPLHTTYREGLRAILDAGG